MSKRYFLKYKDKTIGKILVDDSGHKSYRIIDEIADNLPLDLGYPFGLYPVRLDGVFAPDKTHKPNEKDINRWISERVFPSNRQGVSELLTSLGVKEYDALEIAVKTKGLSFHDDYWITEDPNIPYQDVSLRCDGVRRMPARLRVNPKNLSKVFKKLEKK